MWGTHKNENGSLRIPTFPFCFELCPMNIHRFPTFWQRGRNVSRCICGKLVTITLFGICSLNRWKKSQIPTLDGSYTEFWRFTKKVAESKSERHKRPWTRQLDATNFNDNLIWHLSTKYGFEVRVSSTRRSNVTNMPWNCGFLQNWRLKINFTRQSWIYSKSVSYRLLNLWNLKSRVQLQQDRFGH